MIVYIKLWSHNIFCVYLINATSKDDVIHDYFPPKLILRFKHLMDKDRVYLCYYSLSVRTASQRLTKAQGKKEICSFRGRKVDIFSWSKKLASMQAFPTQKKLFKSAICPCKRRARKIWQGYNWFSKRKLVKENLVVVYTTKKTLSMENCKGKHFDHLNEQ